MASAISFDESPLTSGKHFYSSPGIDPPGLF